MTESDPYKAPQSSVEPEPDEHPSPLQSSAGLVSLVLTMLAILSADTIPWPVNERDVVNFSIVYGSAIFLSYRAFRIGGLLNLLFAVPAIGVQLYIIIPWIGPLLFR